MDPRLCGDDRHDAMTVRRAVGQDPCDPANVRFSKEPDLHGAKREEQVYLCRNRKGFDLQDEIAAIVRWRRTPSQ